MRGSFPQDLKRWIIVVPLSVLLGWVLDFLNIPAAWVLAGIIVAGASAIINGAELKVNKQVYTCGSGIVAVLAAVPIASESPHVLINYLIPGLVVAAFTLFLGVLSGLLLAKALPDINRETGLISMLAGGAAFMPAIAEKINADIRFVSLSQYLRLLMVAASLPLITSFLPRPEIRESLIEATQNNQTWWMIAIIIVISLIGNPIARAFRIPVPAILGPLLITLAVLYFSQASGLEEFNLYPPEFLTCFAFLSIGWLCGGMMSRESLQYFSRQIPRLLVFIVVLIIGCAAFAGLLAAWINISYFDAYLATSPGAMDTVLAISSEVGISPVVTVIQLIRMIVILIAAAFIPQFLGHQK